MALYTHMSIDIYIYVYTIPIQKIKYNFCSNCLLKLI